MYFYLLPIILTGDFNVNFANNASEPLIKFLKEHFNLTINNDRMQPTTRGGIQLTLFSQGFLIPLTQERSYHITVIISLLFQHSV